MKPNILFDSLKDSKKYFESLELSHELEKSANNWECKNSYMFSNSELSYRSDGVVINDDDNIVYEMNNYCHRSSDFIELDKNKYNVLFAGCSVTFGDGLPYGTTWDHIVYNQLSKHYNLGSFNSISYPGGSAQKIITNIFKYCNSFGLPSAIYLFLPDYTRETIFIKEDESFHTSISIDYYKNKMAEGIVPENIFYNFQNSYRMLEIFCKNNNIKLICSSWDVSTGMLMDKLKFNNFYFLDYKDDKFFESFDNSIIKKEHLLYEIEARDKHHFGIATQHWFANKFLEWSNYV